MADFPIVQKLGGREQVRLALAQRGMDKTRDAIRMWTSRRAIPGKAYNLLHEIAAERGIPITADDFRIDDFRTEAA